MRHFFSPRVRAVMIISLVIAVLLAVTSSLTGKNIPVMLVQTVMTPLRAGAKVMTDPILKLKRICASLWRRSVAFRC